MKEAKPFVIDKTLIYKAYLKVKENKGRAEIDTVGIEDYEKDLGNRLYKLWNRMSSGSYIPNAVRQEEIPKPGGGKRPLGIPTVEDRLAPQAAALFTAPPSPPSTRKKVEGYEAPVDFLAYTHQCRKSCNRKQGQCFTNFLPAISKK